MDEVRELKPRRVGEIISHALDLYGKHWARLMAITAVVTVPITLLQYYLFDLIRSEGPRPGEIESRGFEAVTPSFWRATAASAVLGILSIFIYQVLVGAVARSAAGITLGRDLGIGDAYKFGYARVWSILLVGVLVGLAVLGGFVLLVIPGFFVMTRLFASVPALVVEGRKGRDALRRSWSLVEGYGLRIFGIILLVGLISGLVSSVFAISTDQGWVGQAVAAALGSVVTGPFVALVGMIAYLDLRARKEPLTLPDVQRQFDAAGRE
jgi:membrane-anchored glycerophosphoryl diester phosphodiesterase (GDPDase)